MALTDLPVPLLPEPQLQNCHLGCATDATCCVDADPLTQQSKDFGSFGDSKAIHGIYSVIFRIDYIRKQDILSSDRF